MEEENRAIDALIENARRMSEANGDGQDEDSLRAHRVLSDVEKLAGVCKEVDFSTARPIISLLTLLLVDTETACMFRDKLDEAIATLAARWRGANG